MAFYIIDFDSTFTKVEALDVLAEIALANNPQRTEILKQIKVITDATMAGSLPFDVALRDRLNLFKANKTHIQALVEVLLGKISDSFVRNQTFIQECARHIYVVSGGFKEFILPVVTSLGVLPGHVFANEFVFDAQGNIIGVDTKNLLVQPRGKVKVLESLKLEGEVCVIGDGYTDYEIKEAGLANTFYLFTENVKRENLMDKADEVINSLDEFLFINNLARSQSYPKSKIKVLLLEGIHPNAEAIFKEEGYTVETRKGALDEAALCEQIKGVHILGLRSKSAVTPKVLASADRLMSIGAFCIGTNHIELETCAQKGIVVFNAPYSNTRSVVELALGEMIMLIRNITHKNNLMHRGQWDKSAANSFEVRGKCLGIVGYGNIGAQLSVLAEDLGMKVFFYDLTDKLALGNAQKCNTLEELLRKADIVTLHVDGRNSNENLIGAKEFAVMKDGALFLNLSRGHVVDLTALVTALKSKKIAGAGVDVFPHEPKTNDEEFISELRGLPNVILTPHIGGSTEEAQASIAEFVPYKMIHYMNRGDTYGAVNFPEVQLPHFADSHRILHIHKNMPGILAQINATFARFNVNILAQYLKTNETIGYVITDVSLDYKTEFVKELKNIPHTIKFRMLY